MRIRLEWCFNRNNPCQNSCGSQSKTIYIFVGKQNSQNWVSVPGGLIRSGPCVMFSDILEPPNVHIMQSNFQFHEFASVFHTNTFKGPVGPGAPIRSLAHMKPIRLKPCTLLICQVHPDPCVDLRATVLHSEYNSFR